MKRSVTAVCLVGGAAALLALPASAAPRDYSGPQLCTPSGYHAVYAPHGYRVCTTTTAKYDSRTWQGMIQVSGKGHTDFLFDASVYRVKGALDYSFRFEVQRGHPRTIVVRESKRYQVAYNTSCTVTVDLEFTDGVLKRAKPSNYCPK